MLTLYTGHGENTLEWSSKEAPYQTSLILRVGRRLRTRLNRQCPTPLPLIMLLTTLYISDEQDIRGVRQHGRWIGHFAEGYRDNVDFDDPVVNRDS